MSQIYKLFNMSEVRENEITKLLELIENTTNTLRRSIDEDFASTSGNSRSATGTSGASTSTDEPNQFILLPSAKIANSSIAYRNYHRKFDQMLATFETQLRKLMAVPVPKIIGNENETDEATLEHNRLSDSEINKLTDYFSDIENNKETITAILFSLADEIARDALDETTLFYRKDITTTQSNETYNRNAERLRANGTINSLNEHLVSKIGDLSLRNLPNFDEYKINVWSIYLADLRNRMQENDQTNENGSSQLSSRNLRPFDLLFQPNNYIVYSPRVVATVYFFKYKYVDELINFLNNTKNFILNFSKFAKDSKSLTVRLQQRIIEDEQTRNQRLQERERIDSRLRKKMDDDKIRESQKEQERAMSQDIEVLKGELNVLNANARMIDAIRSRVTTLDTMIRDYEKREKNFIRNITKKIERRLRHQNSTDIDIKIVKDLQNVARMTLAQFDRYNNDANLIDGNIRATLRQNVEENEEIDQNFVALRKNINAAIDRLL